MKVWISTYYLRDAEYVKRLYLEMYELALKRKLKNEFIKDIYFDGENIEVEDDSKVVDMVLEVCKRHGIVPAIV